MAELGLEHRQPDTCSQTPMLCCCFPTSFLYLAWPSILSAVFSQEQLLSPTLPSSLARVAPTGATTGSTGAGLSLCASTFNPRAMVPICTAGLQQKLRMLSMLLKSTELVFLSHFRGKFISQVSSSGVGQPSIVTSIKNPCLVLPITPLPKRFLLLLQRAIE